MDLELLEGHPMTDAEMMEIKGEFHPSDIANVNMKEYHIYSTDEQVVGKWTDGGDLYEKTFSATRSTTAAFRIPTGVNNITVKKLDGGVTVSGGAYAPIGYFTYNSSGAINDGDVFIAFYDKSSNSIYVQPGLAGDIDITILYTKTS